MHNGRTFYAVQNVIPAVSSLCGQVLWLTFFDFVLVRLLCLSLGMSLLVRVNPRLVSNCPSARRRAREAQAVYTERYVNVYNSMELSFSKK
jgi:hypothetical protein